MWYHYQWRIGLSVVIIIYRISDIGGDNYRIIGGGQYIIIFNFRPRIFPTSSHTRPRIIPHAKSTQNLPRTIPKSFRIHPKFDSESSQHRPNISISISIQNRPEIDSESSQIHSDSSQNRFRIFPIDSESSQHRLRIVPTSIQTSQH